MNLSKVEDTLYSISSPGGVKGIEPFTPPKEGDTPSLNHPRSPMKNRCEYRNPALKFSLKQNNGGGMINTGTAAQSEAQRMLDAFTSIGADRFHVTFTNLREQETDFFKNRTVPSMRYNLPAWLKRAAGSSLSALVPLHFLPCRPALATIKHG